jgi:RHS repeat-associated protein
VTNNLNQYTQVGNDLLTYDADGNLILSDDSTQSREFRYDAESHLVDVIFPDESWQYEYDARGNTVAITTDDLTTGFIVDPAQYSLPVARVLETGNDSSHYRYGLGLTSLSDTNAVERFLDFDGLGHAAGTTTPLGSMAEKVAFNPFGHRLTANTGSIGVGYMGQWGVIESGNGLITSWTRAHDPKLGRFIQQDPIEILGGINQYSYAGNAPVDFVDPSGLTRWGQLGRGVVRVIGGGVVVVGGLATTPFTAGVGTYVAVFGGGYTIGSGFNDIINAFQADDKSDIYTGGLFGDLTRGLSADPKVHQIGGLLDLFTGQRFQLPNGILTQSGNWLADSPDILDLADEILDDPTGILDFLQKKLLAAAQALFDP